MSRTRRCEFCVELTNGPFNIPKQLAPTSLLTKCQDARVVQMDVKLTSQGTFFCHTSKWIQRILVLHLRTGCLFIYTKDPMGFGVKLPNALKVTIKSVKVGPNDKIVKSEDDYSIGGVKSICYYTAKFSYGTIRLRLPSDSHQEWKHLLADCHDPVKFGMATAAVKVNSGKYESQTPKAFIRGYYNHRRQTSVPIPPVRTLSLSKSIQKPMVKKHCDSNMVNDMIVNKIVATTDDNHKINFESSMTNSLYENLAFRQVTQTKITSSIELDSQNGTTNSSSADKTPRSTPFKRTRAVRRYPPSLAVVL